METAVKSAGPNAIREMTHNTVGTGKIHLHYCNETPKGRYTLVPTLCSNACMECTRCFASPTRQVGEGGQGIYAYPKGSSTCARARSIFCFNLSELL